MNNNEGNTMNIYNPPARARNAMHRIQAVAIGADWFALDIANAWKVEAWTQLEKISGFGLRTVIPWENGQTRLQFYRA